MADATNLVGGPAKVEIAGNEMGHTVGGVTATITPQQRMRTVDQFGDGALDVIHVGDEVRCTIPFGEWTPATLAEVYAPGNNKTAEDTNKYMGFGRSAGFIYGAKLLSIIPRLAADAAKLVRFWRATPIGAIGLNFNHTEDRIFNTEFACLVHEWETDGQLIGVIMLAGTAPTAVTTTTTTAAP